MGLIDDQGVTVIVPKHGRVNRESYINIGTIKWSDPADERLAEELLLSL